MIVVPMWWFILSGVLFALLIVWLLIVITSFFIVAKKINESISQLKPLFSTAQKIAESTHEMVSEVHDITKNINEPLTNTIKKIEQIAGFITETIKRTTSTFLWVGTAKKVMSIFNLGKRKR